MPSSSFDTVAKTWDEDPRRVFVAKTVAQHMLDHLELSDASRVLDYGAGTGLVSLELARKAGGVLAVDSSTGMLEILEKKIATLGVPNVRSLAWSIDDAPEALPPINVITGSMVLHHVADPAKAATVFAGLLPPGGQAAFADLDAEDGSFHEAGMQAYHNGFHREQLSRIFAKAGFYQITFHDALTIRKPGPDGQVKLFPVFLMTARKP